MTTTIDDKARKQKNAALELAISAVEKEFGKGSIMRLKDGQSLAGDIAAISSGSVDLDIKLGCGGYPRGRIVEIYGPESSGKTTLALHAIASCQRAGGTAAFIDAEHALDLAYARKLGVNSEELLVSQPDYGEQALEIADMLVRSGTIDLIVIDSVAALVPKAELEGDMGDSHVGLQARLMSQALRKLTGSLNKSHCLMVFINQLRMKIGVMFGNPETTTGGNALKFYASVRLRVAKLASIKEAASGGKEPDVVGNRTQVKIQKNKLAPPFRVAEFDILYGKGISRSGEIIDLASDCGIIEKSGSWFSFQGERIGQGREKARTYLEENPALAEKIEALLLDKHGVTRGGAPVTASTSESAAAGPSLEPRPRVDAAPKPSLESEADRGATNGRRQARPTA
ncbi:MAG: recombinase RecA [Polyangiaceae bacterium]|nr:recombinase RecA [Polyangiaceae bacterium]